MEIKSLHHVAYRCKDAQATVDFYSKVLGLEYTMAIAEDKVPSTGEPDPYMHIFFRMDDGNFIAFFELPNSPEMGRDPNTPAWVQHLALKVPDEKTLLAYKARIEKHGLEVIGPIDHKLFKSIYFFDPSGHRLELAYDTVTPDMMKRVLEVRDAMLDEWNRTKRAPQHARWLHEDA